ncbi:MAG: 5-(carboxyamino)imidazole ribonucleotide synthase [Rhodothermus sp.]|nr:5-(carboxyamino)imidazole ribonucleotide synthase [Rhodothermus sp.]
MQQTVPVIGILGGGQLGRMTAMAALRMGLQVRFLVPKPAEAAEGLGEVIVGDWHDPDVLRRFAEGCTVVTVESEWAPADLLEPILPEGTALWPRARTVQIIRDKGQQKRMLAKAGLPLPAFACCATLEEAQAAARRFGYPVVLKRYRGSYDGYGNFTAPTPEALRAGWNQLAQEDGLLVEAWVPFVRELAVLVARSPGGEEVLYPVVYTRQQDHRCYLVQAPAAIDPAVADEARRIARAAVEAVDGIGITAVELFELADGRILINELAPRPHNTGHYTIEGCYTSQFENHVRAVLNWPLGSPELREPVAVMVNILGRRSSDRPNLRGLPEALRMPGVAVHLYGKTQVRPGRKMGHVTATGSDAEDVRRRAEVAADLIARYL